MDREAALAGELAAAKAAMAGLRQRLVRCGRKTEAEVSQTHVGGLPRRAAPRRELKPLYLSKLQIDQLTRPKIESPTLSREPPSSTSLTVP
jgi:hypothetical protein